ncbi:MAG: DNA polymerase III subunit gamma/tau [Clostridia bacterium]|nr:DNA polymerase III subunit gamma/tau [Clostridia bacterium]
MSHIALYRKYRPKTFKEMIGQEHVTDILKKQITANKISHAYIFSGTRGTGKTSAAKIFARAINCLNPENGEPCNECEACKSILSGDSTDVVEMDAASNNSVENIRTIRQEVIYASTQVKYKVYIIDEAHMLSTSAFNALLKTLEEPPKGVVFILATTEEHKILPTILSRCIRFEFKKLSEKDIVQRLKEVLRDYGVIYEEEALNIIAKLSDGALRDALSILERCINNDEKNLTKQIVEEIIGIVQKDLIYSLVAGVLEYNVLEVNQKAEEIIQKGKDLRYCLSQMLDILMDLVIKAVTEENNEGTVSVTRLNYVMKKLSALDDSLRQTNNVSTIFKAKMLELATEITIENEQDAMQKIKELELKIEKLSLNKVQYSEMKEEKKDTSKQTEIVKKEGKTQEVKEMPKVNAKEFKLIDKVIKKASESDSPRLYSALAGVKAFESGEKLNIFTQNSFAFSLLKKDDLKTELHQIVQDITGVDFEINVEFEKEEENTKTNKFEELMKDTGIPFTMLD